VRSASGDDGRKLFQHVGHRGPVYKGLGAMNPCDNLHDVRSEKHQTMVLCSPDGAFDPLPGESNSNSHLLCLKFETVRAVTVTITVLWLVTSCTLVQVHLSTFRMFLFPPCSGQDIFSSTLKMKIFFPFVFG
jgi:hypothetical protein